MAKPKRKTRAAAPVARASKAKGESKSGNKRARSRVPVSARRGVTNSSAAKADGKALTLSRRACIALVLPPDYEPVTNLEAILKEVGIVDVWPYLRHADDEGARKVVKLRADLAKGERDAVTIDHYIAAAGADFHKIFGVVAEQVSRIEGTKASMIAAAGSPELMSAAVRRGRTYHGHQDAKMVLQTAGVAPVPKNQVTNISVRDSVIDQRRQVAIGQVRVPTLEEVVKDIDSTVYEREPDPRDAGPKHTLPASASKEVTDVLPAK
jgi:hypothetical protein